MRHAIFVHYSTASLTPVVLAFFGHVDGSGLYLHTLLREDPFLATVKASREDRLVNLRRGVRSVGEGCQAAQISSTAAAGGPASGSVVFVFVGCGSPL